MLVVKKNNTVQGWDENKIVSAINKSASRAGVKLSKEDVNTVLYKISKSIDGDTISVSELHSVVSNALTSVCKEAGESYKQYRNYKEDFVGLWDDLYNKTKDVLYQGDKENSNFESTLVSTKGSLVKGYLAKELYKKFYLSDEIKQALEDGFIYAHDLRDLIFNGINCCLFDMANVLKDGFEMSNLKYSEPTSILSMLQVLGDVTLSASAQQFGGFTIAEIDSISVPYMKKTYEKALVTAEEFDVKDKESYADKILRQELKQGIQSLEMKLNSIPSARGDFAFITFSFGALSEEPDVRKYQKLFCETLLETRMAGHGNSHEIVVFPKLVFLFLQEQYDKYQDYRDLVDLGIECSSKALYPDWLSVDGVGYIGDIYKETGKIVSPMGRL